MDSRRFLREELVRQMQQTPVDKLTVQGLCDACGVSKQTFYRHYADKYALLEECFELYVLKPFEEGVGHMSFYDSLVRHFHTMRDQQTFVRNGYLSSDVNGLYQVDVRLTRSALEGRLREEGVADSRVGDRRHACFRRGNGMARHGNYAGCHTSLLRYQCRTRRTCTEIWVCLWG